MTQDVQLTKMDRMRYTKNKLSSGLILLSIVFNALYFVSIYRSDIGSYYYTWTIGASIIYNLLFMLSAFLASEGVKNRKSNYFGMLLFIGAMQVVRIFYLPAKAHATTVIVKEVETIVMGDSQYMYTIVCLGLSAVCCIVGAVTSFIQNRSLDAYMRSLENQSA